MAFHPIKVMVIALLLAVALIPLWPLFSTNETRVERLWAPQESRGVSDQKLFNVDYGRTPVRREQIIITHKKEGGNVLQLDVMKEVLRFDEMFRTTTIDYEDDLTGTGFGSNGTTTTLGWQDMCVKLCTDDSLPFCDDCRLIGHPLEFWFRSNAMGGSGTFSFDGTKADTDRTPCKFQPNQGDDCSVSMRVDSGYSISASESDWADPEQRISIAGMYAGIKRQDDTVVSAKAIMYAYLLNDYTAGVVDEDFTPQMLLEEKWAKEVKDFKSDFIKIEFQSSRAISDAFGGAIGPDLVILNLGFVAIIVYTIFVLGDIHPVRCRCVLALCGVIAVIVSIFASFGISSGTGLFFSPVTNVLPFILVGIGVDDMFVIVHGFDNTDKKQSVEYRIAHAMGHVGVSITITSLTDMLAFALGATSSLPAVTNFCGFAAWGIFIDYLLQISFFVGALVLDARRQDKGCGECCGLCLCCGVCKVEDTCCDKCYNKCYEPDCCQGCAKRCKLREDRCPSLNKGVLHCLLDLYSTYVLPKVWCKVLVIVLMAIMACLGSLGASQIKQDFSMRFFVPNDNPLWSFFNAQDEHFGDVGAPVSIITGKADYSALRAQEEMRDMLINVDKCNRAGGQCGGDWILPGTVDSWHSAFVTWAGTCSNTVTDRRCYPASAPCEDEFSKEIKQAAGMWTDAEINSCADLKSMCGNIPAQFNPCRKTCELSCDGGKVPAPKLYSGPLNQWECDYTGGFGPNKSPNPCYKVKLNEDGLTVPPEHFYDWLHQFLEETREGGRYKASVQWKDESDRKAGISGTRSRATYAAVHSAKDEINSMKDLRVVVDEPDNLGYTYPFFYGFIFYEQYAVIIFEFIQNLSLALLAVFLICFALLTHFGTTILVVIIILIIDVEIVGLMYVWGVSIDSVSVTNLVLAVGLAVDYSVHVAHAFLLAPGRTRNDRVRVATLEMGVPVLHGAMSTFCAVVLLSAAGSYIFIVFFKMFFAICLFGVLNGLILLPIILSLIGPGQLDVTPPRIPDAFANKLNKARAQVLALPAPTKSGDDGDVKKIEPAKASDDDVKKIEPSKAAEHMVVNVKELK